MPDARIRHLACIEWRLVTASEAIAKTLEIYTEDIGSELGADNVERLRAALASVNDVLLNVHPLRARIEPTSA